MPGRTSSHISRRVLCSKITRRERIVRIYLLTLHAIAADHQRHWMSLNSTASPSDRRARSYGHAIADTIVVQSHSCVSTVHDLGVFSPFEFLPSRQSIDHISVAQNECYRTSFEHASHRGHALLGSAQRQSAEPKFRRHGHSDEITIARPNQRWGNRV
jgi:hypothetical protein